MAIGNADTENGFGCPAAGLRDQSRKLSGFPGTGERLRLDGSGFGVTGDNLKSVYQERKNIMKKSIFSAGLVLVMLIMIAGGASAGTTYDPKIQDRIAEQQKRLDDGISSQALTRAEAVTLQDNLNWIKGEEARLKKDGLLTKRERVRLHRMLDLNSTMIFKKKHNPVRRLYP